MIKDKIFEKRGPWVESSMRNLLIRGDATHISDCLARQGWNGNDLVVCPVLSLEPTTGKIKGSRWAVRGDVASYRIKAQSIWSSAKKDVEIQIGKLNH